MLKRTPNPSFTAHVTGIAPGGTEKVEFLFKHKTRSELKAYLDNAGGRKDEDLLEEIVADWPGLTQEWGAFNRDNLSQLLDAYPAAAGRIVAAYVEALAGARLGN